MPKLVVLVGVIVAWLVIGPIACSDDEGTRRVLAAQGYSDVRTTGYRFFGCGEGDAFHTGFEAKGPTGLPVSGVVCTGLLFKSSTVRVD